MKSNKAFAMQVIDLSRDRVCDVKCARAIAAIENVLQDSQDEPKPSIDVRITEVAGDSHYAVWIEK